MPDLIGQTLGQYQILREIGRGGMAVVYEAFQPSLNRSVAIKLLPQEFTFDKTFVGRFLQEARAAARLEHPNIVPIYDVREHDGHYYIVMRALPGEPLHTLIQHAGRLPLDRAAHIVAQIAAALDYAHAHGIVHRDIKPANVIVGPDDHAILTDFGIAKAAEGTMLTQTGTLVGTPEYMSPEQAQGHTVGPASDVYSLGIVLYQMLSGRVPFKADSTPALLYKQVYEQPAPVRTHVPDLPPDVEAVLARALAKDPAQRFSNAGEMAAALQAAVAPVPPRPAPTPVKAPRVAPPPAAGKKRPAWLWPVAGGALVLILALGAVLALSLPSPTPTPAPAPTATATSTPDLEATARALAYRYGTETAQAEATINAIVERRGQMTAQVQAETATAAAQATGTVEAGRTAQAQATGTTEAVHQTETRSAQETASAVAAAAATREARAAATAAAQESATREAVIRATATQQARLTETARSASSTAAARARATQAARPTQPSYRCFEASRRHWEKSQAGAGEIWGIVYDRNKRPFSGATVHLYIASSNWETRIPIAPDGIYGFCCLAYSAHNLHVVELVGNGIKTVKNYEFRIDNPNLNRVLVDFYEVSCP